MNTHALTVRDGPDSSAALITILDFEDEVELMETSDGWGRVRDLERNIAGWANLRYLQQLEVSEQTPATPPMPASETAPPAPKGAAVQKLTVASAPAVSSPPAVTGPTPSLPRYFVNTHELTVRDGPDMDASYITFLNFEDEVELLETSDGWGRVRDLRRNIVGWANMRYLQRLAVSEQTAATPHMPASETAPPVPQGAAVQKLTVPSAPAVSSPPAVTGPTPSLPRYFVNTHELTVRDGPDMDASYITFLNFKDEVELLETSDGWGRVRDLRRNIVGWANMRYLQRLAVDGP